MSIQITKLINFAFIFVLMYFSMFKSIQSNQITNKPSLRREVHVKNILLIEKSSNATSAESKENNINHIEINTSFDVKPSNVVKSKASNDINDNKMKVNYKFSLTKVQLSMLNQKLDILGYENRYGLKDFINNEINKISRGSSNKSDCKSFINDKLGNSTFHNLTNLEFSESTENASFQTDFMTYLNECIDTFDENFIGKKNQIQLEESKPSDFNIRELFFQSTYLKSSIFKELLGKKTYPNNEKYQQNLEAYHQLDTILSDNLYKFFSDNFNKNNTYAYTLSDQNLNDFITSSEFAWFSNNMIEKYPAFNLSKEEIEARLSIVFPRIVYTFLKKISSKSGYKFNLNDIKCISGDKVNYLLNFIKKVSANKTEKTNTATIYKSNLKILILPGILFVLLLGLKLFISSISDSEKLKNNK